MIIIYIDIFLLIILVSVRWRHLNKAAYLFKIGTQYFYIYA